MNEIIEKRFNISELYNQTKLSEHIFHMICKTLKT